MFSRKLLGIAGYSLAGALVAPQVVRALLTTEHPVPEYHAAVLAVHSAASAQLINEPALLSSRSSEEQAEYELHDYAT